MLLKSRWIILLISVLNSKLVLQGKKTKQNGRHHIWIRNMPFFLLQISGLYIRSTNKLPLLLPNYQDPTLWDVTVIYPHWNIQVGCKEGVTAPGWRPSYSIWALSHSHNAVSSQRRLRWAQVSQKNHKAFLVSLLCSKTRLFSLLIWLSMWISHC